MLEFNQQTDGSFIQGHGGDTSNCAISASRQGAKAGYLTSLGDDQFGRSFLDLWQSDQVDVSQVKTNPDAPTGIYFVTHDDAGHHYTYYRKHSAAAQMQPQDLSADYISQAKFLHVSAISQAISPSASDTVVEAIRIANETGTKVAYDTNLRLNLWGEDHAREVVHCAMKQCDIALPSYDDARILTKLEDPDQIADFYLDLGADVVALKLGEKGVIIATPAKRKLISPNKVATIDTNAAGDTFAGAFLAQLSKGQDYETAAEHANIAAALSTQSKGAASSIPNQRQVADFRSTTSAN